MYPLGAFIGTFVVQLPILAVLVLGLVLLSGSRRRLPGRAGVLARAGLAVLLVEALLGVLWSGLMPLYLSQATFRDGAVLRNIGLASAAVQFLLGVLVAAGLGLLLAALLTDRHPAAYGPPPHASFPTQPYPAGGDPPFGTESHPPSTAPPQPPLTAQDYPSPRPPSQPPLSAQGYTSPPESPSQPFGAQAHAPPSGTPPKPPFGA
jgi:hypothetical protein